MDTLNYFDDEGNVWHPERLVASYPRWAAEIESVADSALSLFLDQVGAKS